VDGDGSYGRGDGRKVGIFLRRIERGNHH
jgi:hypothetical protein